MTETTQLEKIRLRVRAINAKTQAFADEYPLTYALMGAGVTYLGSLVIKKFLSTQKPKRRRKQELPQ